MNKLLRLFDNYLLKYLILFILFFTAIYPKLPTIHINHTWVYVRLEDFLIGVTVIIWFIRLLRRKVTLILPIGWAFIAYWIVGFFSLLYSILFIGPHLPNFFPAVATLEYFRRIEYMILFFVAFSTIKSKKDIRDYVIGICITLSLVVLYGFGQKFYLFFWHLFPKFFEKYPFCFPSFQTGNEEFAKGIGFCLTETSRITSTFGGHYDLAAYLVLLIPVLIAVALTLKRWFIKVLVGLLAIFSLILLVFTASRTSFVAYLIGVVIMLIYFQKKKWIIPVTLISVLMLFLFSGGTLSRLTQLVTPVFVVSGRNTGSTSGALPADLQKQINKTKQAEETQSQQALPPGTVLVGKSNQASAVSSASASSQVLTPNEAKNLKLVNGNIEISTESGSFLIQKAYALDISFTTRFQAEWPRDWDAFLRSPLLGTGYSSLTLASDNDYLRAIGETGILGLLSFLFIFVMLGILMKNVHNHLKDPVSYAFIYGLSGGMIGLFLNAILIDVFEASKVAEPLWILLGIGTGALYLSNKKSITYKQSLISFLTSKPLIACYLLISLFIAFGSSLMNFFVADDFTWLHWAASSTVHDIPRYFIDAQNFFYRPLDKTILYYLYAFFSFQPEGYHLFNLFIHWLVALGVYILGVLVLRKKFPAFIAAMLFALLPVHGENIFWISTISTNLSALWMVFAVISYIIFRRNGKTRYYLITFIFSLFALFSYEMAAVIPFLFLIVDIFLIQKPNKKLETLFVCLPFMLLSLLYVVMRPILHVVSMGGDYSYSFKHFIPNFFGNFIGYFGIFIFGEHAFAPYTLLRNSLRIHALPILLFLVAFVVVGLLIGVKYKVYLSSWFKKTRENPLIFCIAFMIVSLLPFIGLGNITERYGYLASVGFVLLAAYCIHTLYLSLRTKSPRLAYICIAGIFILISVWYTSELQNENKEWQHASSITHDTLTFFRLNYAIPNHAYIYFVNVPIKKANAFVFPWGLEDGLWFIYRDPTIHITKVGTVDEARTQRNAILANGNVPWYIFQFDDNGKIWEVR